MALTEAQKARKEQLLRRRIPRELEGFFKRNLRLPSTLWNPLYESTSDQRPRELETAARVQELSFEVIPVEFRDGEWWQDSGEKRIVKVSTGQEADLKVNVYGSFNLDAGRLHEWHLELCQTRTLEVKVDTIIGPRRTIFEVGFSDSVITLESGFNYRQIGLSINLEPAVVIFSIAQPSGEVNLMTVNFVEVAGALRAK